MTASKAMGSLDSMGREVFVVELPDLATPLELGLPSPRFACLVAYDSSKAGAEELLAFARSVLRQGAAYVCAWGPGCRDVEDAFDQAEVELDTEESEDDRVVMTTSHPDDSLQDALEFLSTCAFPHEAYVDDCRSSVGIVIGNPAWSAEMEEWFSRGARA